MSSPGSLSSSNVGGSEPVLRSLSPLLRHLQKLLRTWLDTPHRFPLPMLTRASLEGLASDLQRQADSLDADRPLLVIMFMGGTGVGKSTFLNALAGGDSIALASFARPTTRDPVVYYHESIKPDRLDPALRNCRLAPHARPELAQKILVDTPDLDSTEIANHERLKELLPVADIVLYVSSQEKYHDRQGWDLFLQQRKRRAFAFVMNKWDRCLHQQGPAGIRPDEDLLRDLKEQGFANPLLFRTCAQLWVDLWEKRDQGVKVGDGPDGQPILKPTELPEGEQFLDLVSWMNTGLTRLEIEAIKARGIAQLFADLATNLEAAAPPDLSEVAAKTRASWARLVDEEASATGDVLINTLDPFQSEIERHFAHEVQKRFRGLMAGYLGLFGKVKFAGKSMLTPSIPFVPKLGGSSEPEPTGSFDLSAFTRTCSSLAGERHLDARGKALCNRLLLEADQQGFPLDLVTGATESAANVDWRQRYAQALVEILHEVEQQWSRPTGFRRVLQLTVIWLADWLPSLSLFGTCVFLLWQYTMMERSFNPYEVALPFFVLVAVLVVLHVVISLVMPMRWPAMRDEFHRQLGKRLETLLEETYLAIPGDVADRMAAERRDVEKLLAEVREVADWLQKREKAANITALYGN